MKNNSNVKIVTLFLVLAMAPFVPVLWGFSQIRSAVVLDRPINWQAGVEQKVQIPQLKPGQYELRLESGDSKFDGSVQATWNVTGWTIDQVEGTFQNVQNQEWPIVQSMTKLKVKSETAPAELSLNFLNSSPKPQDIRLKVAQDRDVLLQKSTNAFQIVLAISLALMLLIWRPMTRAEKHSS